GAVRPITVLVAYALADVLLVFPPRLVGVVVVLAVEEQDDIRCLLKLSAVVDDQPAGEKVVGARHHEIVDGLPSGSGDAGDPVPAQVAPRGLEHMPRIQTLRQRDRGWSVQGLARLEAEPQLPPGKAGGVL